MSILYPWVLFLGKASWGCVWLWLWKSRGSHPSRAPSEEARRYLYKGHPLGSLFQGCPLKSTSKVSLFFASSFIFYPTFPCPHLPSPGQPCTQAAFAMSGDIMDVTTKRLLWAFSKRRPEMLLNILKYTGQCLTAKSDLVQHVSSTIPDKLSWGYVTAPSAKDTSCSFGFL